MTNTAPPTTAPAGATVNSPARLAWRRLRRNRIAMFGGCLLVVLYLLVLFSAFLSPYDPRERDYTAPNMPPTPITFTDTAGNFTLRPHVYEMRMIDLERQSWAIDPTKRYPVKFFVRSHQYKLWGLFPSNLHLFGVDAPGRIAIMGTDPTGKDMFSRVLKGGQISLSIGLLGIAISLSIGLSVGAVAGYFGGWSDSIAMRFVEFLMSVPTLYLIIVLRAYFQSEGVFGLGGRAPDSTEMYIIIVFILAFVGWAGHARVVRGMVLSLREQDFVMAERALGASTTRIIFRHIIPNTMSYIIIAATISVPGYILGEVALSFLGVGIQEPDVSWGNMLEQGRSLAAIQNTPWMLMVPASFIFVTVMAYNFLGDGLRDALDPRHSR